MLQNLFINYNEASNKQSFNVSNRWNKIERERETNTELRNNKPGKLSLVIAPYFVLKHDQQTIKTWIRFSAGAFQTSNRDWTQERLTTTLETFSRLR